MDNGNRLAEGASVLSSWSDGGGLIDWAALSRTFKGDMACIDRLIGMLLATHHDIPARLREAAAGGKPRTVAALAVYLRNSAFIIEAAGFKELACQTEHSARRAAADTPALAESLAVMLEAVCAEAGRRAAGRHGRPVPCQ